MNEKQEGFGPHILNFYVIEKVVKEHSLKDINNTIVTIYLEYNYIVPWFLSNCS